jgi:CRISPR-associated endonuclease/helicase Cas3
MSHPPYAHTLPDRPHEEWEPLFTPLGEAEIQCRGRDCEKCERLEADHGHLNKVAFLAAKFASEMFRTDSTEAKSAADWGYLAGLWHDLGKFAPVWQTYLKSKADIHSDEVLGKVDHSTAGAQHATKVHSILGHLLGYPIAGHHSGLLDGVSNNSCQAKRLQKVDLPEWQNAPLEVRSQAIPPPLSKPLGSSATLHPRCLIPNTPQRGPSCAGDSLTHDF